MIYLFDDTYCSNSANFSVEDFTEVRLMDAVATSDLDELQTIIKPDDCILIHRSYRDADPPHDTIVFESIVEDISVLGEVVPLVIFSDGDILPEIKNERCVTKLKKSIFYDNLKYFVDIHNESGCYNLHSLAYGEKSLASIASDLGLSAIKHMKFMPEDEIVQKSIIDLKSIRYLMSVTKSGDEAELSIDALEQEIVQGKICVRQIRDFINRIINSVVDYGKNIYSWK